jgi:hypothetical protein
MTRLDDFAEALDAATQLKADTDLVHQSAVDRMKGIPIDRDALRAAVERLPLLAAKVADAEGKAGIPLHAASRS